MAIKIGASSHKTNYIDIFTTILNPDGLQHCCIGSKVLNAYWWSFIGKALRLQPAQQACFWTFLSYFYFKTGGN